MPVSNQTPSYPVDTKRAAQSSSELLDESWQKALAYAARGRSDGFSSQGDGHDPGQSGCNTAELETLPNSVPVGEQTIMQQSADWRAQPATESATGRLEGAAQLWRQEDVPLKTRVRQTLSTPVLAAVTIAAVALTVIVFNLVLKPQSVPDTAYDRAESATADTEFVDKAPVDSAKQGSSGKKTGASLDAAGRNSDTTAGGVDGAVIVHIIGQVQQPGVYELPAKSRVKDLVEAAGGLTDAAVLTGVNLARVLNDGEQIHIPTQQEIDSGSTHSSTAGSATGSGLAEQTGAAAGKINLNTATAEQLQQLPRVGPATAQKIVEWRTKNGGFKSIEQLLEIPGIGDKTLQSIAAQVSV